METKMNTERIYEFLQSDDLEMVRLGARLLQEFVPHKEWPEILTKYSTKENPTKDGDNMLTWYPSSRRWDFEIKRRRIIIKEYDPWAAVLGTAGYATVTGSNNIALGRSVTIRTGAGGYKMIQQAFQNQISKHTKPTKHEQTKKKQWRKQTK